MTIGRRLAAARVERGLGVEDVSRATRIRVPIVQAIESDDFAAAGPGVYARGHIRSIAGLLGLDPAPLLAQYDAEHGGERGTTALALAPQTWERVDPAAARADRRTPSWLGAAVVTAGVLVGLLVVGLVTEGQPRDQVVVAGPSAPSQEPPRATPEVPGGAGPDGTGVPPVDVPAEEVLPGGDGSGTGPAPGGGGAVARLPVRVSARAGRSWLEVTDAAGERVFAGMLEAGAAEEFDEPSGLRLVIGDARAVRLEVGGRGVPVPGGRGQVAKLRVRAGGVVTPG